MKKDKFFVERDKLFGKLVLKNGTVLYLKEGGLEQISPLLGCYYNKWFEDGCKN